MRKPMERNELARSPDISRSLGEKNMVTGIQNSILPETVHTVKSQLRGVCKGGFPLIKTFTISKIFWVKM